MGPWPAERRWGYSTARVDQIVDFSLSLPVEDVVCVERRSLSHAPLSVPPPPDPPHVVFSGEPPSPPATVPAPLSSAWSQAEGIQPEFDPSGPESGQEDRDFDRFPSVAEVSVPVVYLSPDPGGPRLLGIDVQPGTGLFRLRYAGISGGRSVAARYWHVSGLAPSPATASFSTYGGGWIRPPAPGLYEFQVASVGPALEPLVSNSIQAWYKADEYFHRPFSESRMRVPPLRLVMPPTTTPQPTPAVGSRPARPSISVAVQDYSAGEAAIRVVVPSHPPGTLQYRYWRHTGRLPPVGAAPWVTAPERDFLIKGLPEIVVAAQCQRYRGVTESCPIRVPVFWDVQVRVINGLASDVSPARSVLVYGVSR